MSQGVRLVLIPSRTATIHDTQMPTAARPYNEPRRYSEVVGFDKGRAFRERRRWVRPADNGEDRDPGREPDQLYQVTMTGTHLDLGWSHFTVALAQAVDRRGMLTP